jgi:hypothetical protein
VRSTLLTTVIAAGVGLMATILLGTVLVFFDIANTDPTADAETQTGLPPIVFKIALVGILTIIWAVACRLGAGAPGDAVMNLVALDVDGGPASRATLRARAAVPVALFGVLGLLDRPGAGMVALGLLWLPAFVRSDRRSAVDLLVGVVPHTTATRRDATPHPWAR